MGNPAFKKIVKIDKNLESINKLDSRVSHLEEEHRKLREILESV
jgi:hypothetical protein